MKSNDKNLQQWTKVRLLSIVSQNSETKTRHIYPNVPLCHLIQKWNGINIEECKNYTCWLVLVYSPQPCVFPEALTKPHKLNFSQNRSLNISLNFSPNFPPNFPPNFSPKPFPKLFFKLFPEPSPKLSLKLFPKPFPEPSPKLMEISMLKSDLLPITPFQMLNFLQSLPC